MATDPSLLFQKQLPGKGSDIVSVLASGGYVFAGCNGYTHQFDSQGNLLKTFGPPGNHEVRFAISDDGSTLFVGSDGCVWALSTNDLSTIWPKPTQLSTDGSNVTNLLYYGENLYATCNGYVFMLDIATGAITHTNPTKGMGTGELRFAVGTSATGTNFLFAGLNGYLLALELEHINTVSFTQLALYGGEKLDGVVSVLCNGSNIYVGLDGYALSMTFDETLIGKGTVGEPAGTANPSNGFLMHGQSPDLPRNNEVRLAISSDGNTLFAGTSGYAIALNANVPDNAPLSTQAWQTSVPGTGYNLVSLLSINTLSVYDSLYAGSNGLLWEVDFATGAVAHEYTLGLGNEDVRLAVAGPGVLSPDGTVLSNTLYVGTDGYLSAVDISTTVGH